MDTPRNLLLQLLFFGACLSQAGAAAPPPPAKKQIHSPRACDTFRPIVKYRTRALATGHAASFAENPGAPKPPVTSQASLETHHNRAKENGR